MFLLVRPLILVLHVVLARRNRRAGKIIVLTVVLASIKINLVPVVALIAPVDVNLMVQVAIL